MRIHGENRKETNQRLVAHSVAQKRALHNSDVSFIDKRPLVMSGISQRKSQSIIDHSPRTTRIVQLQSQINNTSSPVLQKRQNGTGLPDNLKSGMENLSGMSLDHVKVHYNSSKPATVQAHAYAQGSNIHLARGQKAHLAHELGHVVQQMQGRVKATTSDAGVAVNNNAGLENEATAMGQKAVQRTVVKDRRYKSQVHPELTPRGAGLSALSNNRDNDTMQLKWVDGDSRYLVWDKLLEGAKWYYDKGTKKLFYVKGHEVSKPLSHNQWRQDEGFKELEKADASVITIDDITGDDKYATVDEKTGYRDIVIKELSKWTDNLQDSVSKMSKVWLKMRGKEKAKEKGQCSGKDWGEVDEGADVAKDMLNPEEQTSMFEMHKIYAAYETGNSVPVGVMVVDVREADNHAEIENNGAEKQLYIRWLIGHPKRRGGGSALMDRVKVEATFNPASGGELRVYAARGAGKFYAKHMVFVKPLQCNSNGIDCGCSYMKWTKPK